MKQIRIGDWRGDETAPFSIEDYQAQTAADFVNEVLKAEPRGWGRFRVSEDGRCRRTGGIEYRHGELLSPVPERWKNLRIAKVKGDGGWSCMDYYIFIDNKQTSNRLKLYIATPINARKEDTFEEKYKSAKERLEYLKPILRADYRFNGWEVVGGTDICPLGTPENEAIKRCVQEVFTSDAIYMDVGWQNSDGCRTELETAGRYKIPIYTFDGNVIKFE